MKNKKLKKEINWLLKEKYKRELTVVAKKDIKKLKRGEPIDYLIGFVEFLGCRIDLSQRPLIPRPETEYWVGKAIEDIKKLKKRKIYCLDIFAGSGCIGIAILKNIKNSKVDFTDINKKFLKQIRINLKLNRINKNRYRIISSNIFSNIIPMKSRILDADRVEHSRQSRNKVGTVKYDYIFANPPYIAQKRLNKVQKSVLKFEPKKALLGGEDGLLYIRKFLKDAKRHLTNNGKIYMEFDSFQRKEIIKILNELHYSAYKFYRDQYDRWRYLVVG